MKTNHLLHQWVMMLQKVRHELGDIPIQQLAVLLQCAIETGLSVQDIETRLKMTKQSASRNVLSMTPVNARRQPGPGLINAHEDPADRRRKIVELTPKGEQFIRALLHHVAK